MMNHEKKTEENRSQSNTNVPTSRVSVVEQNGISTTLYNNDSNKLTWPWIYCQVKGHSLYKFNEFMVLNRKQREHVFAEQNWCTNRSSPKHALAACQHEFTCRTFEGKHPKTIWPVKYPQKNPPGSTTSSTVRNSSNTVIASSSWSALLQTSVLSETPVKTAPVTPRKHMWLGALAFEIYNPNTGKIEIDVCSPWYRLADDSSSQVDHGRHRVERNTV